MPVTLLEDLRRHPFGIAVVGAVAVLAALDWILMPEQAFRWLRGMLFLPALWAGLTLWYRAVLRSRQRRGLDDAPGIRAYFDAALRLLVLAGGLELTVHMGLAAWVRLAGREDPDIERRVLLLTVSAVFVIFGNALPKILTPLSMLSPEAAARVTAARRFIGLTWVMLGSTMALASLATPLAFAAVVTRWAAVGCILTIPGAIVWMNLGPVGREG
jgi:hypothetical protein